MTNLKKKDTFIKKETGLSNSMMYGANNKEVKGKNSSFLDVKDLIDTVDIDNIKDIIKK